MNRGNGFLTGVLRVVGRAPLPALHALATVLYWLVFRVLRYRSQVIRTQLRRSFPALDAGGVATLAAGVERRLADVAVEIVKGFALTRAELARRVSIEGLEAMRARLLAGQPVVVLAAHLGNWEWLLQALAIALNHPVDALYKPLHGRAADRALRWMRARFGARAIPAKAVLTEILRQRGRTRVIAMVADQVPRSSPTRTWLRFLGQETAFHAGPEAIARATGYPVFVALMERRARGHYRARVELLADQADPPGFTDLTGRYARRLEAHLERHPADWLWSHRRWKIRRPVYEPCRAPEGLADHGS